MSDHEASGSESVIAAFEQSPWPMTLLEGPDLVMTALNAAGRAIMGDGVGQHLDALFTEPADDALVGRLRDVLETGSVFEAAEWPVHHRIAGVPTTSYHHVLAVPFLGPDGSIRGVIGQAVDVTDVVIERRMRDADQDANADVLQAQYLEAQSTIASIQDALLPEGLPIPQGLHLAARYLLAEDGGSAGGDWFDAVTLDDGRVVLSVGDVVGHGLRASVVMGELKTLFEERVRTDGDIAAALRLIDDRARRVPQARATTICVALLDPSSGELTYCTAGHPPPLVIDSAGQATYLPPTGSGPLGFGLEFELARHTLGAGELLLLYSDGLVERPGRSLAENTLDLAQSAAASFRDDDVFADDGAPLSEQVPERVVRRTVEHLITATGYSDDITLMAAHRVALMAPLHLTLPAEADTLRVVRHELAAWLEQLRVGPVDEMALQHAVGELVSNVLEHAYVDHRPTDACVKVDAVLTPSGAVEVTVADVGHWKDNPDQGDLRGRGLAMASGFADDFKLEHDERGTRATVCHRVLRSAELLTTARRTRPRPPRDVGILVEREGSTVFVSGALDTSSADELRRRLAHASRGGTADVTVDLSGVTVLASAAVQVLWEEVTGSSATGSGLHLYAPRGSTAQHVLDIVRLPYGDGRGNADPRD